MKTKVKKFVTATLIICTIFSFAGCSNKNDTTKNRKNSTQIQTQTSTKNNISNDTSDTPNNKTSRLNEDDFIITYKKNKITVGKFPEELFNNIGSGTANIDNNWGFVGYDDTDNYKYYSHSYPSSNPLFTIRTRTKIADGSVVISDIDITKMGTRRKIKLGNTNSEIIAAYGEPNKIIDFDDNITNYEYFYKDKILDFYLNSKTNRVTQIIIRYNQESKQ